jgi:hypothetical protein
MKIDEPKLQLSKKNIKLIIQNNDVCCHWNFQYVYNGPSI